MNTSFFGIFWPIMSVLAGGMVGYGFGKIQDAAARRYHKLQQAGQCNSSWAIVPGSMRRTAWLLVALALVQVICPMLFTAGCQWWVSGGVVAGYGVMLYRQFRLRLAAAR